VSTTTDPTTTVPTPTAPSIEVPGTDRPNPPAVRSRRRKLSSLAVVAALAAGGGTVWVTAGTGDSASSPLPIVEDGRWGGPDVYEHSRTAPEGAAPDEQQYGSADAAEGWTLP
jgi:hypothetical protein